MRQKLFIKQNKQNNKLQTLTIVSFHAVYPQHDTTQCVVSYIVLSLGHSELLSYGLFVFR